MKTGRWQRPPKEKGSVYGAIASGFAIGAILFPFLFLLWLVQEYTRWSRYQGNPCDDLNLPSFRDELKNNAGVIPTRLLVGTFIVWLLAVSAALLQAGIPVALIASVLSGGGGGALIAYVIHSADG
jgi:hypothetical protein